MADNYEPRCQLDQQVKDLGRGAFGFVQLMRHKATGELVAVKLVERRPEADWCYVKREVFIHRMLRHPHIVEFKEVFLTPTHLAIAMEYADGGELFNFLSSKRRFREDMARYFFQQMVIGMGYCHSKGVCHRDLKLENILLHRPGGPGSPPVLKIVDWGMAKDSNHDSAPNTVLGSMPFIAPEIVAARVVEVRLQRQSRYDGRAADIWSCGVCLYLMLVGAYPFQDPAGIQATLRRIMTARYSIPPDVAISNDCRELLQKMLTVQPQNRITIASIKEHEFFQRSLPRSFAPTMTDHGSAAAAQAPQAPRQSLQDLRQLLQQAQQPPPSTVKTLGGSPPPRAQGKQ